MPVVAVINRKGGSGKSTLATQLAGHFAQCGLKVMLGDVDRQQSSLAWLRRRATHPLARTAEILPWALDTRNARRPPPGVSHVVLDTPGGMHGLELARVVMNADMILVPVSPSAFDRESAAESLSELLRLPRVATGRCRLAVIGMRMDARSRDIALLNRWATSRQVCCLGALRDSRVYPRTAEDGLSLFDLPAEQVRTDLAQWQGLLDWVNNAPQGRQTSLAVGHAERTAMPAASVPKHSHPTRLCATGSPLAANGPAMLGLGQSLGRFFTALRSAA